LFSRGYEKRLGIAQEAEEVGKGEEEKRKREEGNGRGEEEEDERHEKRAHNRKSLMSFHRNIARKSDH